MAVRACVTGAAARDDSCETFRSFRDVRVSVVKNVLLGVPMAHVQITMLAGRTMEQKRRAVKRITDAMREELNVKAEKLTVAFVEVPRESYARNGILLSDRADLK
jgi:4-oxalocrotonate tautomerase